MDLNYLFFRQQIERSRADTAANEPARRAHEGLARIYEMQIVQVTSEAYAFPPSYMVPATGVKMDSR